MSRVSKTLILFTDHFPYGNQEAYLHDEMRVLPAACDDLLIVPFKEFDYDPANLRRIDSENVHIVKVNTQGTPWGVTDRMYALRYALAAITEEVILGRHRGFHLRNLKRAVVECVHAAYQAKTLAVQLAARGIVDPVLYNYWVSSGVLISDILIRRHGVKSTLQSRVHAIDLYNETWSLMITGEAKPKLLFNRFRLRRVERLYPISSHGAEYLKAKYPFVASKLSIQRLGVIDPCAVDIPDSRNQRKLLVSCSSITPFKRVHLFPEIIKRLKTPVQWVHLGGGIDAETAKVKHAIEVAGVSDRCTLLGQTQHADVIQFYRDHPIDLFMNISLTEGTPVSLMEAASFGIPMLATRVMGTPEIVNETNGILVDPDEDLDSIAQKIESLLTDERKDSTARAASLQTFQEKYNASKNYVKFAETLMSH